MIYLSVTAYLFNKFRKAIDHLFVIKEIASPFFTLLRDNLSYQIVGMYYINIDHDIMIKRKMIPSLYFVDKLLFNEYVKNG